MQQELGVSKELDSITGCRGLNHKLLGHNHKSWYSIALLKWELCVLEQYVSIITKINFQSVEMDEHTFLALIKIDLKMGLAKTTRVWGIVQMLQNNIINIFEFNLVLVFVFTQLESISESKSYTAYI